MDTLYYTVGSGNSFKPALVLRQTGRRCTMRGIDVLAGQSRAAEFLAINPRGQVPYLVTAEGVGLGESNAIAWYLAEGTPLMHIDGFVRGKGKFIRTEYIATDEKTGPRFPLLLTTGRILSQYNVGAQTARTPNNAWHDEDVLEIHPFDAENRGINSGDRILLQSRSGATSLRAVVSERMQPGVVYTTFHHPETGANVVTTEYSDWATNCPEYKVTAVEVTLCTQPSEWQLRFARRHSQQRELLRAAAVEGDSP